MNKPAVERLASLGFQMWSGTANTMRTAHSHPDIEINFIHEGELTYSFGSRDITVPPQQLFLFWAGLPHLSSNPTPPTLSWIVLPLEHLTQLNIPTSVWQALLDGDAFIEEDPAQCQRDLLNFKQWSEDFSGNFTEKQIASEEITTRLKRFFQKQDAETAIKIQPSINTHKTTITDALLFIDEHFSEIQCLQEVADELAIHPKYLSQQFRQRYGTGAWEYILRLRIHAAQRLLMTTTKTVAAIAYEVGFESLSAFYAAFNKYSPQTTPKSFRRLHRAASKDG